MRLRPVTLYPNASILVIEYLALSNYICDYVHFSLPDQNFIWK